MNLFSFIGEPLKYVLQFIYSFVNNYAITIVIFTVLLNFCLFPLNVKQQKSMAKQAKLKPKLDVLKEKCGDDRMKYQTAMADLYQKEGVSATAGCLPMLLRMVILMGVYGAIITLSKTKGLDFNFFGINLSETPVFSTDIIHAFKPIWMIPILSFVTSLVSAFITNAQSKKTNPQAAGGSMMVMMLLMPIFSLWIAFSVPGAVGFYWACSNLVMTLIQVITNHMYSPDRVAAMMVAKDGMERRKKESEKLKKIRIMENIED